MANHFSQYAILVLLLLTTCALMITGASNEVCNKNGGADGNNCSSLQPKRCHEKLFMPMVGGCDKLWCHDNCALKHPGHQPYGKCFSHYMYVFCNCTFNC
ncbi:hypothetical protein HN51_004632 [Arachis hypogaea]